MCRRNSSGVMLAARAMRSTCDSMAKTLVLLPGPGLTDRMVVQCAALGRALRKAGNPLADYLAWLMESSPNKFWVLWDVAAVAAAEGVPLVDFPAILRDSRRRVRSYRCAGHA